MKNTQLLFLCTIIMFCSNKWFPNDEKMTWQDSIESLYAQMVVVFNRVMR
jgi:hypothetical protein